MNSAPENLNLPLPEQRFTKQLQTLKTLMAAAAQSNDIGLTLYQSGARQTLFYLEGLARMYMNIHNAKRFQRMRLAFKSLEDQLGKVDYYDGFIKEFSEQKDFPQVLLQNLKQHYNDELDATNKMLRENEWITDDLPIFKKISDKLQSADWKENNEDRNAVAKTILAQIDFVQTSYEKGTLNFRTIENGVHEFRRQLRWISIYAQQLDGLVQLRQIEIENPKLKMYLTKEVIESPFNKMPPPEQNVEPLYIEAPNFYALSWIINRGGELKDEGLRILIIEAAIRETKYTAEAEVKKTAKQLAITSTHSLSQIKETMEVIADDFIYHNHVLRRISRDLKRAINS